MTTPAEFVTIREHIEQLFAAYRDAHRREHELLEKDVERARHVVDTRLETMNELRAQILSERGMFRTAEVCEAQMKSHATLIDRLESVNDVLSGKIAAEKATTRSLIAVVGIGVSVLALVLRFTS